jgi:energy-coupling factor transport system permease protein
MLNTSIYCPGKSVLHRANPLTKSTALLALVATSFILPPLMLWMSSAAILLIGAFSGVGRNLAWRYVVLSLPFTVAVFIFHGAILPRPDMKPALGWLFYSSTGLDHASLVGGRISLILSASLLFVSTTAPATLLRALDAARWPPGLSFLLASPLLLLDQFTARAKAISNAQQARGLRVDGTPWRRLQALRMLLVPLLTSALADAQERSHVLTARGFRALPSRTVVDPPADTLSQRVLRWLLTVLTATGIVIVVLR